MTRKKGENKEREEKRKVLHGTHTQISYTQQKDKNPMIV
jgi:hypothetical protein